MPQIPRDPAFDSTLAILNDGYEFIENRCRRFGSDLFTTRIMGTKAVCMHGREAAEIFYDEARFQRHSALPRRVVTSLFGKGAIHTLDDAEHHQRKAAFLSLMTPGQLERLMGLTAEEWRTAIRRWQRMDSVILFDEVPKILAQAVCTWAGVPVTSAELPGRARDLVAMVDAFGGVGPRLWKGKLARLRAELWLARLVWRVRRGGLSPTPGTALYVLAQHRDLHGRLLSLRLAAVELLNVIRPTVAVAWYVAFAALALHQHPQARERIAQAHSQDNVGEYADWFMQEVRRFYPFTPYLGAKVRRPFTWKGQNFGPGMLVLLDVYGYHHDSTQWKDPDVFRPERFEHRREDPFDFIPQGGGTRDHGHRCPGEWITMHNIALALHFLTRCMTYDVAAKQDLSIDLSRMPTRPRSGFVIHHVRATAEFDQPAPRVPSMTAARDCQRAQSTGEVARSRHA